MHAHYGQAFRQEQIDVGADVGSILGVLIFDTKFCTVLRIIRCGHFKHLHCSNLEVTYYGNEYMSSKMYK